MPQLCQISPFVSSIMYDYLSQGSWHGCYKTTENTSSSSSFHEVIGPMQSLTS